MSEHITHIAVYEDCTRIVKHAEFNFTSAFREALEKAYDSGIICTGSRGNHLYAIPILEQTREIYGNAEFSQEHYEQIAGAIGWLIHRASDLQMKPLFAQVDELENPVLYSDECQMYHDAVSYKEVYKGGALNTKSEFEYVDESLLSPGMQTNPAAASFNIDRFENLLAHYNVSEILRQCKFTKKLEDVNDFTDKMVEYSLDLYEDLRMYIRAYNEPEPFKFQGYINDFNIYNREDDLIRFARYVQDHQVPPPGINLEEALLKADEQSHYSRALKRGYEYIITLSEFFDKKISRKEVIKRCEI